MQRSYTPSRAGNTDSPFDLGTYNTPDRRPSTSMVTPLPNDKMSNSLEDLIPLVNKLQDLVFNTIGSDTIDLPQVVVVGSQSSGKSSVLENIVGRDFLPRGTGIVTRRPLILQLVNTAPHKSALSKSPRGSGSTGARQVSALQSPSPVTPNTQAEGDDEWAEFLHLPSRRFQDFNQVRTEIEQETSRIAGLNKGINRQPIHLKIYSPHVLNLTLVDLPGLTKIPIGDQPGDIERQVLALIREYIAKPNSIILAVSPANVDLVNSEGLKLARQVDPQGKRTIGVLTKLDLMDHGTNALDILSGRVYPLKLGFIGCVNRSQQDIQGGKPLADALGAEREFFGNHPAYRNIGNKCGTAVLAKTLNTILMQHIREKLPDIKARLNTLIGSTQHELNTLGGEMMGKAHRGSTILQLMTRFATRFVASIDGTSSEISTKELSGGARVYHIFHAVYGNALSQIDPTFNLSTGDIRTAIRNATGPRASLFVPELAFDLLVKPQIQLLEPPSQRCVELVYEELMKICHACGGNELARYPKLQMRLIEVVSDLLRERLKPTSDYVESLIAIQRAYINTNHPNFLGGAGAVSTVLQQKSDKEQQRLREQQPQLPGSHGSGLQTPQTDRMKRESVSKHAKPHDAYKLRTGSPAPGDGNNDNGRDQFGSEPSTNGHTRTSSMAQVGTTANAKDGFLTYFFGSKEHDPQQHTGAPQLPPRAQAMDHHAVVHDGFRMTSMTRQAEDIASSMSADMQEPQLTDREQMETDLIRNLISSYFHIVRETVQDQVPKAVMHLLVNHSKSAIQNRLVAELYKEEYFDMLLYEDEGIAQERDKCATLLGVYSEASKIIQEVL
ncbi:Dynamin central region-domain-containing protein [Protomyces lactucae-debilis]|uniref:dynamin GTPase n=1 Tax=Protomyces lactucae-debilis TaxID=2754530 RepID=A0A1Y2FD93_PROLT|nr:Dynamin central region-domain-containing protein [Protomyces lactucae-debilis]ORY81891.1 Dynamin central region-domain-containing protein [Protomyces lactucae-debilis]